MYGRILREMEWTPTIISLLAKHGNPRDNFPATFTDAYTRPEAELEWRIVRLRPHRTEEASSNQVSRIATAKA